MMTELLFLAKLIPKNKVVSFPDDVFHHFKFLLELFSNEFVFIPGQAVQVSLIV